MGGLLYCHKPATILHCQDFNATCLGLPSNLLGPEMWLKSYYIKMLAGTPSQLNLGSGSVFFFSSFWEIIGNSDPPPPHIEAKPHGVCLPYSDQLKEIGFVFSFFRIVWLYFWQDCADLGCAGSTMRERGAGWQVCSLPGCRCLAITGLRGPRHGLTTGGC